MPRELPLLRWYREIAQEGNSRGVIYELTNLVDESLMGRYEKSCRFLEFLINRRFSDTEILRAPWFCGDHWASTMESKCNDLFMAGETPLEEETPSDSSNTSRKTAERRRSRGIVKGKLLTKMYDFLKVGVSLAEAEEQEQKSQLMLLKLQPTCHLCGATLIPAGRHYRLPDSAVTPTHSIHFRDSECYCEHCAEKLPPETRGKLELVEGVSSPPEATQGNQGNQGNVEIPSKLFRSRQGFLNICQENHLHFHEVGLGGRLDVASPRAVQFRDYFVSRPA